MGRDSSRLGLHDPAESSYGPKQVSKSPKQVATTSAKPSM